MQPRLIAVQTPPEPRAVVLVLHGGGARREREEVNSAQLSVLRMIPIARRIARAARSDLAVFRLLNSHRGWDATHTPVDDVLWAKAEISDRYGSLPVGLVGHSLGGRAAILAAAHPGTSAVVALNPWLYGNEQSDLTNRSVLIVHGDEDRIADPHHAELVARRLSTNTDVRLVVVRGGKHAMLRHHRIFDELASDFLVEKLLPTQPKLVASSFNKDVV